VEEESCEYPNETTMVLWDVFPGINLTEDDEKLEETLVVQTRSKGPYSQPQAMFLRHLFQRNLGLLTQSIDHSCIY
jgi:hypothetical protein